MMNKIKVFIVFLVTVFWVWIGLMMYVIARDIKEGTLFWVTGGMGLFIVCSVAGLLIADQYYFEPDQERGGVAVFDGVLRYWFFDDYHF